jgi:hypothetical protein
VSSLPPAPLRKKRRGVTTIVDEREREGGRREKGIGIDRAKEKRLAR